MISAVICWHSKNESDRQARELAGVVEPSWQEPSLAFSDSKKEIRGIEMTYGKVGVQFATWFYHWDDLDSSTKRWIVISILSVFLGLCCLFASRRI